MDKPNETLHPKTSAETSIGQTNQEMYPFCEWTAFVSVSVQDRKLSIE